MALEGVGDILKIPQEIIIDILSNLNIPAQFLTPLFSIPYANEISLVVIGLFTIISIFVGIKWILKLVGIAFVIVGFLQGIGGGITAVIIILGIAVLVKILRKILGKGEGFGKGLGKEEKMPEIKEEEFKMPEMGGEEEFKMPEEKPEAPIQPEMPQVPSQTMPQQRVCPYCSSPLTYISQYQRYYCSRCQMYI